MKLFIFVIFLLGSAQRVLAAPADLEYFKQFLYQDIEDKSDPDFPSHTYRWLMSKYNFKISIDDQYEMEPRTSLFLLENGTYKIVYDEMIFEKKDPSRFYPGFCKVILGRWDVPDKNLELDRLAVGERLMVNEQHAVSLQFKENINKPVLKDVPIPMTLGFGNYSIDQAKCFFE